MITWFRSTACKRWLRARKIKLASGPCALHPRARLLLEEGVSFGHVELESRLLEVGAASFIRSGSELLNVQHIGRFCSIGNDVLLGQDRAAHPLDWVSSHPFQQAGTGLSYDSGVSPATLGHDVWVGRGALIFEGVTIGTGAVVAARALVTRDVPPYAIVAGVPAKIVRFRHPPEIIAGLLESRWWEYNISSLLEQPLSQPEAFLQQFSPCTTPLASYRRVEVTRSSWRELPMQPLATDPK